MAMVANGYGVSASEGMSREHDTDSSTGNSLWTLDGYGWNQLKPRVKGRCLPMSEYFVSSDMQGNRRTTLTSKVWLVATRNRQQ